MAEKLTKAQIRFLRLHASDPAPHRWAWLQDGQPAYGDPTKWTHLRAWSRFTRATVTAAEMEGLRPYWADGFTVNEAGRQALLPTPTTGDENG